MPEDRWNVDTVRTRLEEVKASSTDRQQKDRAHSLILDTLEAIADDRCEDVYSVARMALKATELL